MWLFKKKSVFMAQNLNLRSINPYCFSHFIHRIKAIKQFKKHKVYFAFRICIKKTLNVSLVFVLQDHMVQEGLVWVDDQDKEERLYWFPGLFPDTS